MIARTALGPDRPALQLVFLTPGLYAAILWIALTLRAPLYMPIALLLFGFSYAGTRAGYAAFRTAE